MINKETDATSTMNSAVFNGDLQKLHPFDLLYDIVEIL